MAEHLPISLMLVEVHQRDRLWKHLRY
uniref:Succinyl-CoA ligase beta-chain n=1 Tax=Arundo donax TaxID=35708 RepID=A0A0A9ETZ6_ARUDO